MDLFSSFGDASWNAWRAVLDKVTDEVRELYVIAGRGSGKSRIAALLATCFAVRTYRRVPGERIFVGVFGPDRKQAKVTFSYILGLLRSVPELASMIEREVRESVELTNGVTIEVLTASQASARSRAYAIAVVEEAAFLPQDDSASPDVELVRALRPALARVQGSLLAVVSSPYARRGVIWTAYEKYRTSSIQGLKQVERDEEGRTDDPSVVVVNAPTKELNPLFDAVAIEKAFEEDPIAAGTEYGAQFRSDVEDFVQREVVEACVILGRHELAPEKSRRYRAFVDPSGGRVDSMTMAIGYQEEGRVVVAALVERKAPFSPEQVVEELAARLRSFGVVEVKGDRYGGEWPAEMFRKHGVTYEASEKAKSELYLDALPLLNSRRYELTDDKRLVEQLVGLERRTARGGRDSIDHRPGAHDDLANVVAGLASLVLETVSGGVLAGKLTW
jgi:hypothetical protein